MQKQPLILIPARYDSSRFPGKPLAKIHNKSMIDHVYDQCLKTGWKTCVITDNALIEDHLKAQNKDVFRVDDEVATGSERIALAFERNFNQEQYSMVINVQGDEPLMSPEILKELADFHQTHAFEITTLIKERTDQTGYTNPNIVKALWSPKSFECLAFSRSPIPFYRNQESTPTWWQHVGVYCYSTNALGQFNLLEPSYLEISESLEQLRALENGMKIGAIKTELELLGVDTPEDILKVEERLK